MFFLCFHVTFGMFYRRTFYNMLPHPPPKHPENVTAKTSFLCIYIYISHYKNILEKCFGIVGFDNTLKTFSACCFDNVLPSLSYNVVGKFYKKHSVIGGLKNMPKTFSKCCLKNVLSLLFCNIMGMFYRRTFYNLLRQQHHQNIFRMLH